MTDWKNKGVGSLTRKHTTETKPVIDERDGSVAGHHVEHFDGSQDAVARPATVVVRTRVQEQRED